MTKIALAAAIRELRDQVTTAMIEGEGQELRFRIGPIELELQVELTREGDAEGKISVWVAEVGINSSMSRAETHMVKLSLEPIVLDEQGQPTGDALINRERRRGG